MRVLSNNCRLDIDLIQKKYPMNYKKAQELLLLHFNQHKFRENLMLDKRHASKVLIEVCSNGSKIYISFPGNKSKITEKGIVYDYRVDFLKNGISTSLSHTNIITDIFNKIVNGKLSAEKIKQILIEIAIQGEINLTEISANLTYQSIIPPKNLLEKVNTAHGEKPYNQQGNVFDLSIEELLLSIKWIVLQEDINYPIAKNYEGLRMPFARYIEAIYVTQNSVHTLDEVIKRALAHSRPAKWKEMDYSFLKQIS